MNKKTAELRCVGFSGEWKSNRLEEVFDIRVGNNSLSRENLSTKDGEVSNIHYGDILVKYGSIVDISNTSNTIPLIKNSKTLDFRRVLLKNGDIVFADASEDEMCGKMIEIYNPENSPVVAGLHTIAYSTTQYFAHFFWVII